MLRLSGLVLLFLLLNGVSTPALALGIPYPDPCSLYGLSTGAAASGDITPAQVAPLGDPGFSQYYIASGYGVFVCSSNLFINGSTAGLLNAIVFASNGNVGMSFNNAYNTVTGHTGGYYTPNPPAATLDVSGLNATQPGPPGNGSYYGTTSPGGVRIGYDSAGCSSTNAGELIYTSSIIEYCNGSVWGALPTDGTGTLGGTSPGVLVELTAGSYAAPSLTFYADTTTGIYQNPVDTMEITTAGTERAAFDASGNLNLVTTSGAYEINSNPVLMRPTSGSLGLGNALSASLTGTDNTGVGDLALDKLTTGSSNIAVGYEAMYYATTPGDSTAIGYESMQGSSTTPLTGSSNTAIGAQSLAQLTTGTNNTAAGFQALQKTTTGSYNTAAGYWALTLNVTGSDSTAIGPNALYSSTAGPNTAAGYYALNTATSGTQNTAIGYQALESVTTTSSNTAVGSTTLSGTTGSGNTGAGYGSSANGSYNVSIGADSGNAGSYNTVVGYDSLAAITGSYNVVVGASALLVNTSGNYNIAIGHAAQRYTGTGSSNISLGNLAMEGSSATPLSGSGNISFASSQTSMQSTATGNIAALTNATSVLSTGSWNIGLGQGALLDLTTGSYNTAIGEHALELDTTSSDNTAIGNTALANTTVGPNTAIGYIAGELATTGTNNTSMGWEAGKGTGTYTGSYNTAVGSSSLTGITGAANHNTAAGYFAGASIGSGTSDNSLFGWKAGSLISSGNTNIAIGESGNITSGGSNLLIGNALAGTTAATSYQLDIGDLIEGLTSSATSPNVSFEKALADASLSVQTPLTGFSITVGNGTGTLVLTPAGTLASGTITMPTTPVKGQILRIASTATVTSLTLSPNTGQSISNAISTITGATPVAYVYLASTTTWYRIQ